MNHAIIFEQKRGELLLKLPRAPSECEMITVNFNSEVKQKTMATMQVRKKVLMRALKWQMENNVAFQLAGVTISQEKLDIYENDPNLLELLPTRKTIPEHVPNMEEESKEWNYCFY